MYGQYSSSFDCAESCYKLARILRSFQYPLWTLRLVYLLTVLTASNINYRAKSETFVGSVHCFNLATASSLSWALSVRQLEIHTESGVMQRNIPLTQLLRVFIVMNAVSASAQICGGIAIAALTARSNDISCRWIILVRMLILDVVVALPDPG